MERVALVARGCSKGLLRISIPPAVTLGGKPSERAFAINKGEKNVGSVPYCFHPL
jgi:hypothetical protein